MIIAIVLVLLFLFFLLWLISYYLVRQLSHPKFFTTAETEEIERQKGYLDGYDELEKEDYVISSYDGYVLHATSVPLAGSDKVVIITHGHTYSRWGSVKYLMMFRRLGYSAVIYDDRGHGDNAPYPVSMGFRESRDLLAVIDDTYRRYGDDILLGLHGESMGSGISLQVLAYHPRISFIVEDCGYSDLVYFTKHYIHAAFHLPRFLVDVASIWCRISCGYFLSEVSAMKLLPDNDVPICFVHGEDDDLIDVANAKRMYEVQKGYKELHLYPGAKHAESYASDPKRYFTMLQNFLEKIEKHS